MTTLVHRDGPSLVSDLMSWMGAATAQSDLKVEDYFEGDRHIIRADIPGVDPDRDIQLSVEGGMLRLRGERRAEEHDRYHTEIRYGSFERLITLPRGTKPEDITAEYADGVLTVSAPTAAAASEQQQSIPITRREKPSE